MIDPYTGEEFDPKRRNQKFATPENRIACNNAKAAMAREERSIIDKPLHVNYRILKDLMAGGLNEVTISQERLIGKGFDFRVHNNVEKYQDKLHYCVYEYVLVQEGTSTKIVRNDRY
jgi:hypothetical protein